MTKRVSIAGGKYALAQVADGTWSLASGDSVCIAIPLVVANEIIKLRKFFSCFTALGGQEGMFDFEIEAAEKNFQRALTDIQEMDRP